MDTAELRSPIRHTDVSLIDLPRAKPMLAEARGVRTRLVGLLFVYVLALTVTEAAQVVGTLLVLSLAITPAAAAWC